ncbi:hypothetical protein QPX54_09750 [Corynebacterium propinquum]|uniref:Head-to-tail adaptor n=1 Tax=Corynebacterium propinquum TaxID=43769 RepID=A0AAP4FAK2_9CORY|nr:hypothetical protein [Corynebacterium propinquum]MDK4326783.1 hypothetical protein [Corynebacterium propinquum]
MLADHGLRPANDRVTQDDVDTAVAVVRELAGWHIFPKRRETLTVDHDGGRVVFLPTMRLEQVLSVNVNGVPIEKSAYSFSASGMLTLRRAPRGFSVIQAEVVHGYDDPPVVAVVHRMAERAHAPSESYSVGGISVGAPAGLTPQSTEWRILDAYKLGPMP